MRQSYIHEYITPNTGLYTKYYFCSVHQNPLHWHKEIELVYCVKGHLDIITSNNKTILNSGEIILINKNVVHRVLGGNRNNVSVIIQIDMNALSSFVPEISNYTFQCDSTSGKDNDFLSLKNLFKEFVNVLHCKTEGCFLELIVVRNRIILELMKSFKKDINEIRQNEVKDKSMNRLVNILEYIEENYRNKILLKDIAEKNYISTYYLSHFFHDKIGMSFRNYLTYIRVYHAREFLLSTKKNILDISIECGFSSSQAFARAFKLEFNNTPTQYRKNMTGLKLKTSTLSGIGHIWQALEPSYVLGHM